VLPGDAPGNAYPSVRFNQHLYVTGFAAAMEERGLKAA
jgi:hypothetical protein